MDGILNLHKPRGMTSHDCVMKVRKLFQTKKVGHTGTLDPDVNGVLPICIGKATKVVEYVIAQAKKYEGEITIGIATTTEDKSGDVVAKKAVDQRWSQEEIEAVLRTFEGELTQVPPMYSAVRVKGKRLYEYARENIPVERPKRKVTIYSLSLIDGPYYDEETARFTFSVECSKGTYVRTLAVDIGEKLGYPAHLSDLVRISSGPFQLRDSFTFARLYELEKEGRLASALVPFDVALSHLPKVVVDETTERQVKNGAILPLALAENKCTVYNEKGECLAVYTRHPKKRDLMKPEKMFSHGHPNV